MPLSAGAQKCAVHNEHRFPAPSSRITACAAQVVHNALRRECEFLSLGACQPHSSRSSTTRREGLRFTGSGSPKPHVPRGMPAA